MIEEIPPLGSRALLGALRLGPSAGRLIARERPDLVLSTGAAPAVPFLIQAARRRIPAYYVESLARLDGPSLTGRILARVPRVSLRTQHESLAWPGWTSVGLGLGHYGREEAPPRTTPLRVVVTVGTTAFDFRRLLARLVDVLPSDALVTWQTGRSTTDGLDIPDPRQSIPAAELRAAMADADVVVAHAEVEGPVLEEALLHDPVRLPGLDAELRRRATTAGMRATFQPEGGGAAGRLYVWSYAARAYVCASPEVSATTPELTVTSQLRLGTPVTDDVEAKAQLATIVAAVRAAVPELRAVVP